MRRSEFILPEGIYLDGNSLGPISHFTRACMEKRLQEWQDHAVKGWEEWFTLPEHLSPTLAALVGVKPEEVITTGTITQNLHSLLGTFYRPTGAKKHIVATRLDFPTDLYALKSWADRHDAELRLAPSRDGYTIEEEDLENLLTDDVALVLLPVVLYASGQLLDIARLTQKAHEKGIVVGVDAAHSIGSVPHQLHDQQVDFAVWCTYKYLNAGPGAPGGLFVHEKHFDVMPGLPGWWGNDKHTAFEMKPFYRKGHGAAAYQTGTLSPVALAGVEGGLKPFAELGIEAIREQSLQLTEHFMHLIDEHLPEVQIVTPRAQTKRGGHVSIKHPDAQLISLALRDRGIIPDFRAPDLVRMAPVALYNTPEELENTVQVLRELLDSKAYLEYANKKTQVV